MVGVKWGFLFYFLTLACPASKAFDQFWVVPTASPESYQQLGQSAIATLTAMGTLWNVRGHIKHIKDSSFDLIQFKRHRRSYLQTLKKVEDFKTEVLRDEVRYLDFMAPLPPSLVQEHLPILDSWIKTIQQIDLYLGPVDPQAVRQEFEFLFRFDLPNQAVGARQRREEYFPLFEEWERSGSLALLHQWMAKESKGKGLFSRFKNRDLFEKYTILTRKLAICRWVEKHALKDLREWYELLISKIPHSIGKAHRKWYTQIKNYSDIEQKQAAQFISEYHSFRLELQAYTKQPLHPLELGQNRKTGQVIETQPDGSMQFISAREAKSYVAGTCKTVLADLEQQCTEAAVKGTCSGVARTVLQKVALPAVLIGTGVVSTVVAVQGFYRILITVISS